MGNFLDLILSFFHTKKENTRLNYLPCGCQDSPVETEIIDYRDKLPRHPTKTWNSRSPKGITNLVVHQAGGPGTMKQIARYHTTPSPNNHLDKDGAPSIAYHYCIEKDGSVYHTNNDNLLTWHVARKNTPSLGILVVGNFNGPDYTGTEEPTLDQLKSLYGLLFILGHRYPDARIYGHCDLTSYKKSCPGDIIMNEINIYRS